MPELELIDERRRARQTNFGSLSAGMIVRGAVPASVLYGSEPPASVREVNANVAATLSQGQAPQPSSVVAMPAAAERIIEVPAPGGQRKAVTVRLDPVHHMRLRLVGSFYRRSAQDILVQALNAYLDSLPASVPGGASAAFDKN
jgi:hypothetical protein